MTNTTQIRAYIESQGLKLGHVARVLGISSSALHQKLNDESDFKVSEADRLSAMLGLTMEQRDACGHTTAALTLQQVDAPFAFSALPNTAQEIEAAQHITELPATGRTSVMVLGAVRGVGGIDSWGTDVEEPYHVSGEEDHSVSFRIVL